MCITPLWNTLIISILSSCIATVVVLVTRVIFYHIRDALPAGSLFHGIKNVSDPCLVFILRMTDINESGKFKTPEPDYSPVSDRSIKFQLRQLTPWVTSVPEAQTLAHILNVLGRIGRTDNIEVTFADTDYDRWDVPMFILGGSWKATRAFETCNPYFVYEQRDRSCGFTLASTAKYFCPTRPLEEDMGLLQKMINPTNGKPVWVVMGIRGAGTVAASYALVRWWKYLGWLYDEKPFGVLVSMNDKDGWQQSHILSIYPTPNLLKKLLHPCAWYNLRKRMVKYIP